MICHRNMRYIEEAGEEVSLKTDRMGYIEGEFTPLTMDGCLFHPFLGWSTIFFSWTKCTTRHEIRKRCDFEVEGYTLFVAQPETISRTVICTS